MGFVDYVGQVVGFVGDDCLGRGEGASGMLPGQGWCWLIRDVVAVWSLILNRSIRLARLRSGQAGSGQQGIDPPPSPLPGKEWGAGSTGTTPPVRGRRSALGETSFRTYLC